MMNKLATHSAVLDEPYRGEAHNRITLYTSHGSRAGHDFQVNKRMKCRM